MPNQYFPALPACALLWLALAFPCAQAAAPQAADPQAADPQAADPQAAVPATRYEGAVRYAPAPAPAATPDRNWVANNAAVAGNNPMMDHAHHAGMQMPMPMPMQMQAAEAPQQCMAGQDGKGGQGGKSCCAGMAGHDPGHDHHAGMPMPADASTPQACTSCQGGCACCKKMNGAMGHQHGAAS